MGDRAGGAERDRTDDLLNANQALSQLSYSPLYSFPGTRLSPVPEPECYIEANWMFRAGWTVPANVTTRIIEKIKEAARVE
jgi:hypothetical protein